MLDLPFPLETIPSESAEAAFAALRDARPGMTPVLLGDADIFSTEWAELVDEFEDPEEILAEARGIDINAWFKGRKGDQVGAEAQMSQSARAFNGLYRLAALPFDLVVFPVRLVRWQLTGRRPAFLTRSPFDYGTGDHDAGHPAGTEMLRSQLAELEAAGEGTDEELAEIRDIIEGIEAEGSVIFPDPVDYVTPRSGANVAAGLMTTTEPWECAAWLQHGAYALCAPKPIFVAHCRWLWDQFGARPITASTDHFGFQMDRPITDNHEAQEVLRRFALLGATEVNADVNGSDGTSLVGAARLWVWWD